MRALFILAAVAASVQLVGCDTVLKQDCPTGSSPLKADLDANTSGNATAKIETPDGGVDLKLVQDKVIPLKLTTDVKAGFSKTTKATCFNDTILRSIAANPDKWVFNQEKDGTFTLQSSLAATRVPPAASAPTP